MKKKFFIDGYFSLLIRNVFKSLRNILNYLVVKCAEFISYHCLLKLSYPSSCVPLMLRYRYFSQRGKNVRKPTFHFSKETLFIFREFVDGMTAISLPEYWQSLCIAWNDAIFSPSSVLSWIYSKKNESGTHRAKKNITIILLNPPFSLNFKSNV